MPRSSAYRSFSRGQKAIAFREAQSIPVTSQFGQKVIAFRVVGLLPVIRLIGKVIAYSVKKAIAKALRNVVQRCCKKDRILQNLSVSRPEGS